MSCRLVIGTFDHAEDLLEAIPRVREQGWRIVDVYVPYPVHGLDQALGLRPSRLSYVAFAGGALGVILALWFQFWASAVSWPINVGGRPWNSLPAFVPLTFEMMVLFAGLTIVPAFLLRCRLFPGKRPYPLFPAVSDNHFVIVLQERGAAFDPDVARRTLRACHAVKVEEREEKEMPRCRRID